MRARGLGVQDVSNDDSEICSTGNITGTPHPQSAEEFAKSQQVVSSKNALQIG